ncbi:MAG TPA: CoA transferase [Acidimicrobiales bacterium]|nr:CoA transferase [Acidimicrobiales bacterium]
MSDKLTTAGSRPLQGLRVIDMTGEWGALCGRLLGDFGADVVLVEPPGGSPARSLPPYADDGQSLWFLYRNFNKRGVVLDIDDDADRGRLLALVSDADVFIESTPVGSLAARGPSPQSLPALFPSLIACSITPFGQTGPYAHHVATDDVVFALSGWLAGSGIPSKPPLLMPGSVPSDAASVIGVFAILSALIQRRSTQRGQHIDVSALEAMTQLNTWGLPNTSAIVNHGGVPNTLRSGNAALYPHLRTKDGYIRLVILAPRQWQALWQWMGSPEELSDPFWATTAGRMQNLDVLNPMFEEFFSTMTMVECAAEAQRRGIVATPMLKPADVLVNEHFISRKTFRRTELAPGLSAQVADGYFALDDERMGFRFRAPGIGEHQSLVPRPIDAPSPVDTPPPAATPPLAGLRVLDFGHGGVGVEGGRMLAEYGADVIKIETRTYPDFMRLITGSEMTPSFASSSRSKRSFGVNAKKPEGNAFLHRLAQQADIVIENNSTGTMDDMGVGYGTLHELNPGISMASSQLVGSRGAYASWIGYGPTTQTFGGLSHLWNFDDGDAPPGNPAIHPDHFVGRLCAIAGLLGVYARAETGSGVHSDIAQVEATIANIGDLLAKESLSPGSVVPMGNDDERGAPWGVFPCAGEQMWSVICVRDDRDWHALVEAMGSPSWTTEAAFATVDGRTAQRREVNEKVAEWTSTLTPREVMERVQARGVPAGAMLSSFDQFTDPHFIERGFLAPVQQQEVGPLTFEGPAFCASGMADAHIAQAPLLGEHTREIARTLLGLTDGEIDRLIADGVLEIPRQS